MRKVQWVATLEQKKKEEVTRVTFNCLGVRCCDGTEMCRKTTATKPLLCFPKTSKHNLKQEGEQYSWCRQGLLHIYIDNPLDPIAGSLDNGQTLMSTPPQSLAPQNPNDS